MKTAALVLIGAMGGAVVAQVVPGIFNKNTTLQWDPISTDVQGNPETVVRYELTLTPAGQQPTSTAEVIKVAAPQLTTTIEQLLSGLPDGVYQAWCRAVDDFGNAGEWSEPVAGEVDVTPPARVINLVIKITGTIQ
jgi:hypothetical protein